MNTRIQVTGDYKEVSHCWACVGKLQFIQLAKEDMHQTWIIPGDKVILYTDHVCFSAIFFLMNKAKLCGAYYQMKSCGHLHFCTVVACCVGALFLGLQMRLACIYSACFAIDTMWLQLWNLLHSVKSSRQLQGTVQKFLTRKYKFRLCGTNASIGQKCSALTHTYGMIFFSIAAI